MSRKTKENLRRIHVNDVDYVWKIRSLGPSYILLRVWLADREHKNALLQVRIRYDDFWLNYGPLLTASQT